VTNKKLTAREAMFCRYLAALGDPREAAVMAGYGSTSRKAAAELITRGDIKHECERLAKNMQRGGCSLTARRGLERLAFGGVGDALQLLYIDDMPDTLKLEKLDLFCVSEIKRPKGGGVEIKFHDRVKALLTLLEYEQSDEAPGAASLYKALSNAAIDNAEIESSTERADDFDED